MKLAVAMLGALLALPVLAQEPQATLTWKAPTAYTDGSPIDTLTPVTYIVERRIDGVWTQMGITGFLTYADGGLTPGEHCYRVLAQVGTERSAPSITRCKTIPGSGARKPRQPTSLTVN